MAEDKDKNKHKEQPVQQTNPQNSDDSSNGRAPRKYEGLDSYGLIRGKQGRGR